MKVLISDSLREVLRELLPALDAVELADASGDRQLDPELRASTGR
jgi:hypothetical protein